VSGSVPGEFRRVASSFTDLVSADGSTEYPAEAGRYHLYASLACPWSHRAIIMRRLKRLEDAVSMSVVDPVRDDRGWAFTGAGGTDLDTVNGFRFLREAYLASDPGYDGRVSSPVLWDRVTGRIVNNESVAIMRMLNGAFATFAGDATDYYPAALAAEIDAVNDRLYDGLNNAVYRAGFATTQEAYDPAVRDVFTTLDWLEERLRGRRYLVGGRITEADWRAFTTLVRFDVAYVHHFRCNLRRLADYPVLSAYLRDLYAVDGVAATVDLDQVRRHYYLTHPELNPSGIIPIGPEIDLTSPHGRDRLP
jgi:glutathionyl-hydroquinone reductase